MSQQKKPLQEVASSSDALKTARSEPLHQTPASRQSMDFIRSLVLDLPIQTQRPENIGMNFEKMLETQLESEVRKLEKTKDPVDYVSFDIPLLIRVFELVREGIKSDVELHILVERIVSLKNQGILTMSDYKAISGSNPQGTSREGDSVTSSTFSGDTQNESLNSLKKLAGIR